jgi:hypothetical protein
LSRTRERISGKRRGHRKKGGGKTASRVSVVPETLDAARCSRLLPAVYFEGAALEAGGGEALPASVVALVSVVGDTAAGGASPPQPATIPAAVEIPRAATMANVYPKRM